MCFTKDEFDYQVLNLTQKFYIDYPNPPYKEIVRKNSRPYNCLLIQSHYGYYICIPYRGISSINMLLCSRIVYGLKEPNLDWITVRW